VSHVTLTWTHPQTGKVLTQEVQVDGPFMPDAAIPDAGSFTNPRLKKALSCSTCLSVCKWPVSWPPMPIQAAPVGQCRSVKELANNFSVVLRSIRFAPPADNELSP